MNKKLLIFLTTIWVSVFNCIAQDTVDIAVHYRQIVKLIREDRVKELALLINFPLKRENPLPDITGINEFILYSPVLLDSSFKSKLAAYDDSDIFEHHSMYGLVGGKFTGDIWIDENGKIETINYSSSEELKLKNRLTKEIQSHIHPSVKPWKKNIAVCETDKFLIRVDLMENNDFRYVAWSNPNKMTDKPDIILSNGVQEFQGTMGGVTYTFKSNEYYYQLARVDMAESDDDLGLFLRVYKSKEDVENHNVYISSKCHELK